MSFSEKEEVLQIMLETGVIGAIRTESSEQLLQVAEALRAGGVRCIEVTLTTPHALQVIEEVSAQLGDVLVGAGTVLDAETARAAILAGAQYLVSPVVNFGVVKMARRYSKVVAPGAFTPTEILRAWEAGADIVKVFPATRVGPRYISDLKAPLPQVLLMPTGGVNKENAADFIRAGADVICVGSALVDRKAVSERRFEAITENARRLIEAVRAGRGGRMP